MSYVENALKRVLDGVHDVSECKVGNYHVWMKYDGYSAMVTVHYMRNGKTLYRVCDFDSLRKEVNVPRATLIYPNRVIHLKRTIEAIQKLGYEVETISQTIEGDYGVHEEVITEEAEFILQTVRA